MVKNMASEVYKKEQELKLDMEDVISYNVEVVNPRSRGIIKIHSVQLDTQLDLIKSLWQITKQPLMSCKEMAEKLQTQNISVKTDIPIIRAISILEKIGVKAEVEYEDNTEETSINSLILKKSVVEDRMILTKAIRTISGEDLDSSYEMSGLLRENDVTITSIVPKEHAILCLKEIGYFVKNPNLNIESTDLLDSTKLVEKKIQVLPNNKEDTFALFHGIEELYLLHDSLVEKRKALLEQIKDIEEKSKEEGKVKANEFWLMGLFGFGFCVYLDIVGMKFLGYASLLAIIIGLRKLYVRKQKNHKEEMDRKRKEVLLEKKPIEYELSMIEKNILYLEEECDYDWYHSFLNKEDIEAIRSIVISGQADSLKEALRIKGIVVKGM